MKFTRIIAWAQCVLAMVFGLAHDNANAAYMMASACFRYVVSQERALAAQNGAGHDGA